MDKLIRNIPDDVAKILKQQAKASGLTLEAYLRLKVIELARKETKMKDQEQKENELLVELCREAGDTGTDEELIDGARGNHAPDLIRDAACGDVAALVQLRHDFGLPIL